MADGRKRYSMVTSINGEKKFCRRMYVMKSSVGGEKHNISNLSGEAYGQPYGNDK
jgi:hypothetical protein